MRTINTHKKNGLYLDMFFCMHAFLHCYFFFTILVLMNYFWPGFYSMPTYNIKAYSFSKKILFYSNIILISISFQYILLTRSLCMRSCM